MGKIIDYVSILYKNIESQKAKLNQTEDEYEKVQIEYEIKTLEEEIKHTTNVLENAFESKMILEFIKEIVPEDVYNKINNDYNARVNRIKEAYLNQHASMIKSREIIIDGLKKSNPNIEDERDPKHGLYIQTMEEISNIQAEIDNPKFPKQSIFSVMDKKYAEELIKNIAKKAEELKNSEDILENLESFLPIEKSNEGVTYPIEENLTQISRGINTTSEVSKLIYENKELMNELTAFDSKESRDKMYSLVSKIESIVEKKGKKIFAEGVTEYNLEDKYHENDSAFKNIDNQEDLDRIYNDDFNLEYSAYTKHLFTELLEEMNLRNMVPEGGEFKEEGTKCYGFTKFAIARNKFMEAAQAKDFDGEEFEETWKDLTEEMKHIESMYQILDKKLGTSYDAMPTNVDTYRTGFIPRRFKQNVAHNAQLSGLYNTLNFIKSHNLTIQQFMEDPTNALKKAFMEDVDKLKADNVLEGKNKGEALFALADPSFGSAIDIYGYIRTVEFINGIEQNQELKRKNSLVVMGMLNAFGKQKSVVEVGKNFLSYGNIKETLQNVLIAEPVDGKVPYIDCYSQAVGRTGQPAVDGEEFVERIEDRNTGFVVKDNQTSLDKVSKMFLFEETFTNMMLTIKQYKNAVKNPENTGKLQNIQIKDLVVAAQELTAKYLLTHDVKEMNKMYDNVVSDNFLNEMKNFIKDPSLEDMLKGVEVSDMGNPQLETILKNKNSLFARKEKSIAKYVKENVRRQDEAYLRKVKEITNAMDALDKQVDAISKKMGKNAKGQTNEEIEAIGMTQRELMNRLLAAQDERIEELRKDYEKGKITKYFFEKRAEQLSSGNIKDLKNMPPLFKVDDPAYKNYKAFKANYISKLPENEREGKTEEDFKADYKEFMYQARIEKLNYISDRVLADHGMKSAKSLSSENEFTAKSTKLDLNENNYKKEYNQYVKYNTKVAEVKGNEKRQAIIVEDAGNELLAPDTEISAEILEQEATKKFEIDELI